MLRHAAPLGISFLRRAPFKIQQLCFTDPLLLEPDSSICKFSSSVLIWASYTVATVSCVWYPGVAKSSCGGTPSCCEERGSSPYRRMVVLHLGLN
ncbi:hypothetical protein EJB05_32335 [Eragrostis curvula]|uniref:Uncharacterized protein n=1 Tax=Eragrostis curvula TaxID=38414 RepID=A0A5J9SWK9_9POAL|nr:hypothetical protein EJB05_51079 [Eragrostis curvula]TVU22622.1 hypothetical protein EJB05_32335 [Eragrostis curvula]